MVKMSAYFLSILKCYNMIELAKLHACINVDVPRHKH